jgi:hypothetical protein
MEALIAQKEQGNNLPSRQFLTGELELREIHNQRVSKLDDEVSELKKKVN